MTKDVCLCNTHVHTGTLVAAIVWICLALLQFASAFVPKENRTVSNNYHVDAENKDQIYVYSNYVSENMPNTNVPKIVSASISFVCGALLVIGVIRRVRGLYYPFLVLVTLASALYALLLILLAVLVFVFVVMITLASRDASLTILSLLPALILVLFILVGVLLLLLQIYFFYIVPKRSLDLLTEEQMMGMYSVHAKDTSNYRNYA
ncbi:hypothetical protein M3Y94_00068600 [Aphelenchoides besseyi]|nr:hypothetical protein M3Y94_00068600 [Aphelenchoides besseyi]KAI6237891.1 hypothetical protein M3Y95_00312400 [Aphelenchoides besseyi]